MLRGEHDRAVEILQRSIGEYQQLDDYDSAVRVGVDAVGAMTTLEQYGSALELCRAVVSWAMRLDEREPSRRRALTAEAMSYLHELARRYSLTHDVVADVRRYLVRINNQRPFPFVPPLSLYTV